ncbi:MAG: InlB B-repeat-containing protein, partial [Paludibacteraceae bacterium]|nr:InlB B-repeat-containing protein [Paludibacteraceae bacterium]
WKSEDGTSTIETDDNQNYGAATAFNGTTPTKDATAQYTYTFDGWATEANGAKVYEIGATPIVSGAATYYAHFAATLRKYTVSVAATPAGYGTVSAASVEEVPYGTAVTENGNKITVNGTTITATPAAATAQYTYTFKQWNNLPATVTADVANVQAEFTRTTNQYDVTFNLKGHGSAISGQTKDYGSKIDKPSDPSEAGYTFGGWYKEDACTNAWSFASDIVTGNTILYAKWTANEYTITFDSNGGSAVESITLDYGTAVTAPANPTREGYTFNGWNPAVPATMPLNGTTCVAQWTPRTYTVTLNTNGGSINEGNVTEYTYGTGATLPTDVTKEGYTFGGWFGNEELTGDAVTDIASDASGDKEYWAKWTKLHAITWMTEGNKPLRTDYVADGEMPSYGQPDPTKDPTEQNTFTFEGWSPAVVAATEDASYTAQFKNHTRYYTITWQNYDGTILETDGEAQNMQYGAAVSYDGDTPTKLGDGQHFYAFKGWSPEVTPDTKVSQDQVYVAQFGVALTVGVGENTEYEVSGDEEVVATTVQVAGHLKVPAGASLTTTDLILEATPSTSGEITGAERVNVTGHAYFDLKGVFKAHTWYAVAVPWQVDVPAYDKTKCGVLISNEGSSFVQQELGRTVDLIYYDGAERAKNGHSNACWRYIEDDDDAIHIMYPGRAYMIYLASDATVIRFKKKADASIHTSSFKVYPYSGNGRDRDANWNGIANPATFQAYINPNASTFGAIVNAAQIYDGDEKSFSVVNLKDYGKLVVGKPVFVQVPVEKTVVANPLSYEDSPSPAPRRVKEHKDMMPLEVSLVANESEKNDRIIIHMSDDKEEDSYIVGKDLMKMGVSDIIPQMWVDRYDSRLCINTVAPVNDVATYPLSLFAPKADEYTVSTNASAEDNVTLYLTFDGRPIWNLTYSPYVASLEKGTNRHYGLMLIRSKAPEVATGIGDVQDGTQPAAQKILLDGQVYILRGGELYSITGQSIK